MGKKILNKYKKKKNIDNQDIDEPIIEKEQVTSVFNLQYLLSQLQSENAVDREHITSIISSYSFDSSNNDLKETLCNQTFLKVLIILLTDNHFQIKYNTISALINLIMSYNDEEIESFLLSQTNFIAITEGLLKDFCSIDNKNTSEYAKVLRTYHNYLDLLMLIFDLYNEDTYQSINFSTIEQYMIELIVNHKEKINVDLYNHINVVLCNIFSVRNENAANQHVQMYITEAHDIVLNGKEGNDIAKAAMASGYFYLICANYDLFKGKDVTIFQRIIEGIYFGLNGQNIKNEMKELYDMVNTLTKGGCLNDKEMNVDSNTTTTNSNAKSKEENAPEVLIKAKTKVIEYKAKSICILLKVFSDIIENVDVPDTTIKSNADIDIEDDEEIEEDEVIKDPNSNTNFSIIISKSLTDMFSMDNYSSLQKMFNDQFILNLLNLFCIEYIKDYFINEMDKLLSIKDIVNEIEYIAFSLINNLIEKIPSIFTNQSVFLKDFFNLCLNRLYFFNSKNNAETLSIVVLSLRNIFDKYKQINTIIDLSSINYTNVFILINNESSDAFMKMNLIDLVAFAFSYPGINPEDNMKVCNELKGIFFKETRIEVLSHVVNAFMDIYKEDDVLLNKNLKSSEVIGMMKNGVNEFRSKMKEAKSSREIDKDGYDYVKETLVNMKRFVKYKEASFIELNI